MTTLRPTDHDVLPQLSDRVFLTDGGIETSLIYRQGCELPEFAAFPLLDSPSGRKALRDYFLPYVEIAVNARVGLVLETPTWRANPDWAALLGYDAAALAAANRAAVELLAELRGEHATAQTPIVVSGCVGPRGDGYRPETLMTPEEAEAYHAAQISSFAEARVDLVTAITMTHTAEAIGVARAAAAHGVPSVISFTVETDGRLPSGEALGAAITAVDAATAAAPAYYMVNCAHPTHFEQVLREGDGWQERVRGLRANASAASHEELDAATELDAGDPVDLAASYARLREEHPWISVLGGCCGTDERHIDAIQRANP
jgi:homocysteine S-methyltransferase